MAMSTPFPETSGWPAHPDGPGGSGGPPVHGQVRQAGGAPVSGAVVTLIDPTGQQAGRGRTAADGSYRLGVARPVDAHLINDDVPTIDGSGSDVLAGSVLPGLRSYPLFHHGGHGTLREIVRWSYALISIGVDAWPSLSAGDQAFLTRLGTATVRIVPRTATARTGSALSTSLTRVPDQSTSAHGSHVAGRDGPRCGHRPGRPAGSVAGLRRELSIDDPSSSRHRRSQRQCPFRS